MKEESISSKVLRNTVRILSAYTPEILVVELPKVHPSIAEEVLRKKAKDLGKNPKFLIALIRTAERHPELQFIMDKIRLVETPSLDIDATEKELQDESSEIFRELKNVVQHRRRLELKKPRKDAEDDPLATIARMNPKYHEKDSIEDLTKYLINNPQSGFYFLRQKNRQEELAKKPVLIAKMIAGDPNLQKTIDKEKICFLPNIPDTVQDALHLFLETIILLSTSQMKSEERRHIVLMREMKAIADTPELSVLPIKEIYELNRHSKEALKEAIDTMLAKLPENEETQLLQKRFHAFYSEESYGLKLYDDVKDAVSKCDALAKVRLLLRDPVLMNSQQFNLLRPYLEQLNENNSLSEITLHNTALDEIKTKNNCLREIYKLILDIENKKPELAERFRSHASDYHELSEKREMDKFIQELKAVKGNLNSLDQAHTDLKDPLLKDNPMLNALKNQLDELTIYSRKFEFDNFQRALKEARKHALETKKQRSSMEKVEQIAEDSEDSMVTSSFSELEIYKSSPPPSKKPLGSPRSGH